MRPDRAQLALIAAIEMFGRQGIDNSSTQAIAKHAGIGNATLFKYYATKDDLIRAAYREVKFGLADFLKRDMKPTDSFEEMLRKVWLNFLEWSLTKPESFNFMCQIKRSRFQDPELEEEMQQRFLYFTVALNAAISNKEVVDQPLELIMATIMAFLEMAVDFHGSGLDISEDQIYQLLLNSLNISRTST